MKIEIARVDDRMAAPGRQLLKSLQNESLSIVDLVIREAFQNSLDATKHGEQVTYIDVNTSEVKTEEVARYFEGIEEALKKKLPRITRSLAISDRNTSGLIGTFTSTDKDELNKSNIYKLIYGISMNQNQEGAGGSWGLGKTSFFRIGVGIVIYYTRIEENGCFEERLAASLIEDSDKENAIMPDNPRGIAWWGEKDDSDKYAKSFPVTNEKTIHEIIRHFNIKPYTGDDTGTTIIIPFIQDEQVVLSNEDKDSVVFPWEKDFNESILMAIKRWYAPRIANFTYSEKFGNSSLKPSLNGKPISPAEFEPVFAEFYMLYLSAIKGEALKDGITVQSIHLTRKGLENPKEEIGYVAFSKLNYADLGIVDDAYLSPLAYIGDKTSIDNSISGTKILAYARKPGMVVRYAVDNDEKWLTNVPIEDNQFILAFFVPNSEAKLQERYRPKYTTLENYLRDTENADHASWIDKYMGTEQITIVDRIKRKVAKTITENLTEREEGTANSRTSVLSRRFGNKFLPKSNFGKSSTRRNPVKTKSRESGERNRLLDIKIIKSRPLSKNEMIIEFSAIIRSSVKSEIYFEVETTDIKLNEQNWTKTFGNKIDFPFAISNMEINSVNGLTIDPNETVVDFSLVSHPNGMTSVFGIENHCKGEINVEGKIDLIINDVTMKPAIGIRSIKKSKTEEE
ncbi:hypothetical protein [Enterococcus faecium]|uniref:hypothetical protein n=1 Tax=Enterococcus faecium TaxID=1352 RepID=UPI00374EB309